MIGSWRCKAVSFLLLFLLPNCQNAHKSTPDKLLENYDLEELTDVLLEYDLDGDGQLTNDEIELQQPGIQKYMDRYEALAKQEEEELEAEEREEEEEEKRRLKKLKTRGKKKAEDQSEKKKEGRREEEEDDGVRIEVVEEMEVMEVIEEVEERRAALTPSVLAACVMGVLTIVLCSLYLMRASSQASASQRLKKDLYFPLYADF